MHANDSKTLLSLENKKLINLGLLLILALFLFVLVSLFISRGVRTHDQGVLVQEPRIDSFANTSIIARSAIVYDAQSGRVLYAKNPDDILPLASITKVLTAVTATELLPKDTIVTIKPEFLDTEGDSGLKQDEKWKLTDLIDFSLMVSSNDGAHAIAAVAGAFSTKADPSKITRDQFIADMNAEAKKIGMKNSHFNNESGLDISKTDSGAYGSARDVGILFNYTLKNKPEILAATRYQNLTFTSLSNIKHDAENTDIALSGIPAVLGSKTGFTDLAGGNLAVTFDPSIEHPITIVVLGSTYDGRFADMQTLVQKTMEYINQGN